MTEFLGEYDGEKRRWRDTPDRAAETRGVYAALQWQGAGDRDPLNVSYGTADKAPTKTDMVTLHRQRHGRGAAPVLLIVGYPREAPTRAALAGPPRPGEDQPQVVDVGIAQAERIALTALDEPTRLAAERYLVGALEQNLEDLPGVVNKGLLASHELAEGVPRRPDWARAGEAAAAALRKRDQELIRALGYEIDQQNNARVLRDATSSRHRAVAVFLQAGERPDVASGRYNGQTPVTYALAQADQQNLRWVVTVRGGNLRLYSTATSGAAGQRGRTDTFVELDLPLLPDDRAAYLHLLFSSDALRDGGTVDEIRAASLTYTTDLAGRLRERVYDEVVPRFALAIVDQQPDLPLEEVYRAALTILFRLLFLAYGEDQRLLPYDPSGGNAYSDHALKNLARRLSESANAGKDLGFDNPLTPEIEPTTDPTHTDLWDGCVALFRAVDEGHNGWGVPSYNGGLFTTDGAKNPSGPVIEQLELTNGDFGPALFALLVDRRADEPTVGPIDFRSLSVREFGTIYEGLLESELARAEQPLTLVRRKGDDVYEPADDPDDAVVQAGDVYLHNSSGARKASGSYFTKPFAVEHLLEKALVPTLLEHLDRVRELVDDRPADAARLLFDFRTADIAMGSGHFLTAVVDTIEKHVSAFLAENRIPQVVAELDALREAALRSLPDDWDGEIEQGALLRRLIARRCVYGVDLNPISVELARVAMWIHTFVPGLPLSFLDHNLIVGNSLTGVATLDEVRDAFMESHQGKDSAQVSPLTMALDDALAAADKPLERLRALNDATVEDVHAAADAAADALEALTSVSDLCDLVVASRVADQRLPDPFVDGIDLLDLPDSIACPAREVATEVAATHLPVAFPEVFRRVPITGPGEHENPPGFDVIVGNPPWEKVKVEEHEFWGRHIPGLRGLTQADKNATIHSTSRQRPDLVAELAREQEEVERLRSIAKSGPYPLGSGDTELARIFAWRFWVLTRDGGRIGVVLPRSVALAAPGMQPWRSEVLETGTFEDVCLLTNRGYWAFDGMEQRYTIALLTTAKRPGTHVSLQGPYRALADFRDGVAKTPARVRTEEFRSWSGTDAFPLLPDTASVRIYQQILSSHRFGQHPRWRFRPVAETHATGDKELFDFSEGPPTGSWPVYSGSSFNLWMPETGEVYAWTDPDTITHHLQEKRRSQANHSRSAFYRLPEATLDDLGTLPCMSPRVAFRDVARATDSRTMICALIPPHVVPQHKAPYLLRVEGGLDDEAYILGVLSSMICDWYFRREVETTMSFTILNSVPVPAARRDHPGHRRVVEIAGTLAAVDDRYADWAAEVGVPVGGIPESEREPWLVELDACVARLYGLEEAQIRHIYETFHHGADYSERAHAVVDVWRQLDWEPAVVAP